MSPETFNKLAPFAVASGTFLYGAIATELHPLLIAAIAACSGLGYDWLDRKLA
ncbi:hypothetical protein [Rhizobium sp. NZLR11]|uniref:hypothetical protein n=1 Tax=Rhizobium sp. NZLR11 TaxID=2731098 RepID=UPI001C834062|nr:hypothetical protein [Rhizobium sp. NZLR11]MBX5210793.1 hypothetical protein [Rhizobium sp. NZLR11]